MSELLLTRDGGTAVVTLSQPGKRNAMARGMWERLLSLLPELESDPDVRVVVLTGADGDFSAGNDIRGIAHGGDTDLPAAGTSALVEFGKPVVAAIQGYALGAGCELAMACDLRISADDARYGIPPANLGLVFPLTGLRLLVDLVGPSHAKRLIFTGQRIDAAEALRIGLVDELVPSADVLPRALALAEQIASRSQVSVRAAKAMLRALSLDADPAAVTAHWRALAADGPDLAEGRAAFAEKRPPQFTWNG